jgi:uncharacterized membrane protein YfhO
LVNRRSVPRAFNVDDEETTNEVDLPVDLNGRCTSVTISEYRNASVRLSGETDHPRFVVLTDNWHHNWRATVNGDSAPIIRVNGTFRGIRVPAGAFQIDLVYRPSYPTSGVVVPLATLVVLILIALWPMLSPSIDHVS